MVFFEGKQAQFFRPLGQSKREKYVLALEAIFGELYSPDAPYGTRFDRRALLQTAEHAIAQAPEEITAVTTDEMDEVGELTPGACVAELEDRGWLESYRDAATITKLYRLTPVGKKFARILWEWRHPPTLTHNRNMRSCDSLLRNFLDKGDAADLVDAERASLGIWTSPAWVFSKLCDEPGQG